MSLELSALNMKLLLLRFSIDQIHLCYLCCNLLAKNNMMVYLVRLKVFIDIVKIAFNGFGKVQGRLG